MRWIGAWHAAHVSQLVGKANPKLQELTPLKAAIPLLSVLCVVTNPQDPEVILERDPFQQMCFFHIIGR